MDKNFENDEILICALKKYDMSAYEYIYKKFYRELYLFALSYMLSNEEAHDLVGDTFVNILENSNKMSDKTDVKGYLYLNIKNNCLNKLKHYKVVENSRQFAIETMKHNHSSYNYEKDKLEHKINKLKSQLSEQQQNVIRLKILGKNYDEIAEELNISKLTVSVHVKRAYKFFRDNILIFFTF